MGRRKQFVRQGQVVVDDQNYVPLGYEQITDLSSAEALTVPEGAVYAEISPEAQGVRWRDDGEDPTAAIGMPLADGQSLEYDADLSAVKFIEDTAGALTGTLQVIAEHD